MFGVSLRIDGDEQALRSLGGIASRLEDQRPMWDEIGSFMELSTSMRFEQGRAPDGSLWPPSWRAREEGGQTLVDTSRLRQSITHNVVGDGVEVGSNVRYAAIHQFGGTIVQKARKTTLHFKTDDRGIKVGRKFSRKSESNFWQRADVGPYKVEMPPRPFLGVDADDEISILNIASRYIGGPDAD